MSQRPISRSADLKRLRDEGYDIEVRSGCLLVKEVPYVNSRKEVQRGILVIKLVLADDQTGRPDTHQAYFSGEHPCNEDGTEIDKIKHGSGPNPLAEGVVVNHSFSAKPKPNDSYPDYASLGRRKPKIAVLDLAPKSTARDMSAALQIGWQECHIVGVEGQAAEKPEPIRPLWKRWK
jgi:hypothetical protein